MVWGLFAVGDHLRYCAVVSDNCMTCNPIKYKDLTFLKKPSNADVAIHVLQIYHNVKNCRSSECISRKTHVLLTMLKRSLLRLTKDSMFYDLYAKKVKVN